MRLEKIKLAGFKSFVDPTTIHFPDKLTGIVGPNGCGKSNVIDAVRWVMGESSAKMLRGESMSDVIFNGSTDRKPVGAAVVELIFDNSDGAAGGEYARFGQISAKRQVSRDGQSTYLLNGTRCRRRDIQDLFLGTGLGPRSYAVIEQGIISRFVEAKPEELRLFLEEAAGISKYKERRRETENRIRHTRDNLDRLEDVREEVAKQLTHLQRQAAAAERYQRLKRDERRLKVELDALKWQALDAEISAQDKTLRTRETALESRISDQRRLEADSERRRDQYMEASEEFNRIQGNYYAVGSEIARLEQAIRFSGEERERRAKETERLERELTRIQELLTRDQDALAEIDAALAADGPEQKTAAATLAQARTRVSEVETELETWEAQWDEHNRRAAAPTELAQIERTHINHLQQHLEQIRSGQGRIKEERERLDTGELETRIRERREQVRKHEQQILTLQDQAERLTRTHREREQALRDLSTQLDAARTDLHAARGRQAALKALQEAALDSADAALGEWLDAQGLTDAPRLLDELTVEPGWERAVETVLGSQLRALSIDSLDSIGSALEQAAPGSLALIEAQNTRGPEPSPGALLARIDCPWPLHGLLGAVRTAATLAAALAERHRLQPGGILVTRDGILVGPDWLRTPEADGALGGILSRAEELKELESRIETLERQVGTLSREQEHLRTDRREIEKKQEETRARTSEIEKTAARIRAELASCQTRLEHAEDRRAALEAEGAELAQRLEQTTAEHQAAGQRLQGALEKIEALAERRQALTERRETLRDRISEARRREQEAREQTHRLQVAAEARRASREAKLHSLERAQEQRRQLTERGDRLRLDQDDSLEPLADQQRKLEKQLAVRLETETQLAASRQRMEELDTHIRELEQERHRIEQDIEGQRRENDALRLSRQERLVRRNTLEEQLAALDSNPQELLTDLETDADQAAWQARLEKITERIARLGNINLASIDELAEQTERKHYLDTQHDDISRSLQTLEQAIHRIDRETRGRFKDTFDSIDREFQDLFPRLFGGGRAHLALTGEDLLETGVTVMARPPGKRNASIHLLSGGEKALTAVALVFAIFRLNPAPFCMLDEVDAPLDDANVGRFCELVRSMSERVQFIFVTHNKLTMEIATHLIGVTTQEPGVSRLVSVNLDEAAGLAAES